MILDHLEGLKLILEDIDEHFDARMALARLGESNPIFGPKPMIMIEEMLVGILC